MVQIINQFEILWPQEITGAQSDQIVGWGSVPGFGVEPCYVEARLTFFAGITPQLVAAVLFFVPPCLGLEGMELFRFIQAGCP